MGKKIKEVNICVITDQEIAGQNLREVVRQSLLGGAEMIQFREKNMGDRDFYLLGLGLREEVRKFGALFLINDRVDQALALGADGVHIGPEDFPLPLARKILGPEMIIGYSVKGVEDALRANKEGADYLGVGPIFPTTSKDAGPALRANVLKKIREVVTLPILAIGGIDEENVEVPILSGADGVAVIKAVMGAEEKSVKVKRLREKIIEAKKRRAKGEI